MILVITSTGAILHWLYQEVEVEKYEFSVQMEDVEIGGKQLEMVSSGFRLKVSELSPRASHEFNIRMVS